MIQLRHTSLPYLLSLLALACACLGCPAFRAGGFLRFLEYDGTVRAYRVYVPASYSDVTPSPLVIALHAANTSTLSFAHFTQFSAVAESKGFLVVYPEALNLQWQDGLASPVFGESTDVGFLAELLDRLSLEFRVDSSRIYLVGYGSGGLLAHGALCSLADRFAAMATVGAAMPAGTAASCSPSRPVSVLLINGTADPVTPWSGGYILEPQWNPVLSVIDTARFWAQANRCSPSPETTWLPDLDPEDATRVWRERYSGGSEGTEVILYGVLAGGHNWPGPSFLEDPSFVGPRSHDIDATAVIWEFFEAHPRL